MYLNGVATRTRPHFESHPEFGSMAYVSCSPGHQVSVGAGWSLSSERTKQTRLKQPCRQKKLYYIVDPMKKDAPDIVELMQVIHKFTNL